MRNRSRAVLIVVYILVLLLINTGCNKSKMSSVDGIVELSFADAVSLEEIEKLDGQLVTMIGFMSTTSPLDGSYMYLQNMPYQSCPFCIPNTNVLANTIAVYAPEGQSFRFQDIPIRVTGKIKVEDVADDLGYYYYYRIVDAKIEKAELSGMGREIRIYTELVDQGFASEFVSVLEDAYVAINYEEFNVKLEEVELLSFEKINEIIAMFNGLNENDYADIIEVVSRLETFMKDINDAIVRKDPIDLHYKNSDFDEIYNEFYMWLIKPSF